MKKFYIILKEQIYTEKLTLLYFAQKCIVQNYMNSTTRVFIYKYIYLVIH
jgi:hypothetical protein